MNAVGELQIALKIEWRFPLKNISFIIYFLAYGIYALNNI